MGMSLERVQFKFASIIGELCSQPDVLSQFAVWLDLRLAEYKLKGAISLDCSGEEPDPIWLKGLSKQKTPSRLNSQTDRRTQIHSPGAYRSPSLHRPAHSSSDSDIPQSQSHSVPSRELAERLSPDVVVVKEEPDVYPVSLHAHENRKRSATDSVSIDFRDGPKQRRMSTTESPSHQSLMSVIGGFDNDTIKDSENRGGNSDFPSTSIADNVTLPDLSADVSVDDLSFNKTAADFADQTDFGQDTVNTSDYVGASPKTTSQNTDHYDQRQRWDGRADDSRHKESTLKLKRLSRIPNKLVMSKARLRNITSAVGVFEHWLWETHTEETRGIHEIQPEQLDTYLCDFFVHVRLPNGYNYSLSSFKSLRSNLDFYLKCTNYPASVTTSDVFRQSQAAFRTKYNELKAQSAQNIAVNDDTSDRTNAVPQMVSK
ncbi:uncharacterized protein LOC135463739 isoform X1 [Liolophura sinensis]|uniref:uncharacterized protein LOC135463739 isoform X1 n=1 Tax=Liolophura sinensis TaxID=3198878 RepID=UPI0031593369